MSLDEKGVGIGPDEGFQLHEMKGHPEQPLPLVLRLTLTALPGKVLHGAAMVGVGMLHTGGIQPAAEFRDMEPNG